MQEDIKKIVRDSKKRCEKLGLDPNVIPKITHQLSSQEFAQRVKDHQLLLKSGKFVLDTIMESTKGMHIIMSISDKDGNLLDVRGNEDLLEQLGFLKGVKFAEEETGTSGIELALRHLQPVALVGKDHYHTFLHAGTCYTIPILDNSTQTALGTITIMLNKKDHNPLLLGLLNAIAKSMEKEMAV